MVPCPLNGDLKLHLYVANCGCMHHQTLWQQHKHETIPGILIEVAVCTQLRAVRPLQEKCIAIISTSVYLIVY